MGEQWRGNRMGWEDSIFEGAQAEFFKALQHLQIVFRLLLFRTVGPGKVKSACTHEREMCIRCASIGNACTHPQSHNHMYMHIYTCTCPSLPRPPLPRPPLPRNPHAHRRAHTTMLTYHCSKPRTTDPTYPHLSLPVQPFDRVIVRNTYSP